MKTFLADLFDRMGESPYAFVARADFSALSSLYYRFHKGKEIIDLFKMLKRIMEDYGSIGAALEAHYDGDIRQALWRLRKRYFGSNDDRLIFFFPKQLPSNPLKRWNLYLRWMVRQDAIDTGIWKFVNKRDLTVPLDTHIFKIGKCLGWTARQTQSWNAACDITRVLREMSPDDPLKYDFFLCHVVGIGAGCTGVKSTACRERCMVYEV
jgi:uncharacterized protein (TIGR02757 family)